MRRFVSLFLRIGAAISGLIILAIIVGVLANVASRLLFHRSIVWVLEFTEYGLIAMLMFGAAFAVVDKRHTVVDLIVVMLPVSLQRILTVFCNLIGLVITAGITWYALEAAIRSWRSGAMLYKFVVIPEWWLLSLLPMGFGLMAIAFLTDLVAPEPQNH